MRKSTQYFVLEPLEIVSQPRSRILHDVDDTSHTVAVYTEPGCMTQPVQSPSLYFQGKHSDSLAHVRNPWEFHTCGCNNSPLVPWWLGLLSISSLVTLVKELDKASLNNANQQAATTVALDSIYGILAVTRRPRLGRVASISIPSTAY